MCIRTSCARPTASTWSEADLTDENDATNEVMKKYEVKGVPTVILFSPQGDETSRMVGYVGPDELLAAMRAVK